MSDTTSPHSATANTIPKKTNVWNSSSLSQETRRVRKNIFQLLYCVEELEKLHIKNVSICDNQTCTVFSINLEFHQQEKGDKINKLMKNTKNRNSEKKSKK